MAGTRLRRRGLRIIRIDAPMHQREKRREMRIKAQTQQVEIEKK